MTDKPAQQAQIIMAAQAWEDAIAGLESLSDGTVCAIDGLIPLIEISSATKKANDAAFLKLKARAAQKLAPWSKLIDKKVGCIRCASYPVWSCQVCSARSSTRCLLSNSCGGSPRM